MTKFYKIALPAVFLLALAALAITGYNKPAAEKAVSDAALYDQLNIFGEAVDMLRAGYVEPVDSKKLIHGAMSGMLSSLDEYSQFLEKSEYEELEADSKGEFGGVGIEISIRDGILTVISPIDGSPAEASGIRPGDKIIKIDKKATEGMAISEAVDMMRGDPGTAVTLTIWREKGDKVSDVLLRRAMIKTKSVKTSEMLDNDVGYIKIVEFQENTARDLDEVLAKLEKSGMKALILDLRNNPGGLLDTASDVAERFLKKGSVVVSVKSRVSDDSEVFRSSGDFTRPYYPIVVLVNGGSASASEVVAGAIQDNKRGKILGVRTFGKASIQAVAPLKDGSAIRFTSAYYYTPGDRLIKKDGIMPDVIVESDDKDIGSGAEEKARDDKNDIQLKKALELMHGEISPQG
jgi:carboxyl-terminal processing protease